MPCLRCGEPTGRASLCPTHRGDRDRARPSPSQRYGRGWQRRARAQVLAHPACASCGHSGSPSNPLTADHVVPVVGGGTADWENLQTLCRSCNSRKGARPRGATSERASGTS